MCSQFIPRDCLQCGNPLIPNKNSHGLCERCAGRIRRVTHGAERTAYDRAYYAAHREEILARVKAYGADHRSEKYVYGRAYYVANRDKILAQCHAYFAAHREEVRVRLRAYYTRHRNAILVQRRAERAEHRDEVRARNRAYRAAHRDELLTRRRADYTAHREERLAQWKTYRLVHPHIHRERNHRRRARVRAAFVAPVRFAEIWERDKGVCGICGKKIDRVEASIDHILPLAAGGSHEPRNVRLAHRSCNIRRKHRGAAQLRLLP